MSRGGWAGQSAASFPSASLMVAPMMASAWTDEESTRRTAASDDSPTHTTHSSPFDGEEELEQGPQFGPNSRGKGMVDSGDEARRMHAAGDAYRCIETPRAGSAAAAASSSVCSIQIQVESGPSRHHTTESWDTNAHRRRRRSGFTGQPTSPAKPSWRWTFEKLPLKLLMLMVPPSLVLILLKFSAAYAMLFALNIAVAFGGWEWSWWSFRIRQRLLMPFRCTEQQLTSDGFTEVQDHEVNRETLAISAFACKFSAVRDHIHLSALAFSAVLSGAIVAVVEVATRSIVEKDESSLGKTVVLVSAGTGCLSVIFCAFLAPTRADGFVMFVYQLCYVVSSLNSFLANHEHLVHDPELLDSMYVLLVGSCVIVVWRIVSSKDVLESTIMVMLDLLGLAYLVAPMMAMGDFLGYPTVHDYGDIVGTFFVVVSAAEAAYQLTDCVRDRFPHLLQRCRWPIRKSISMSVSVESLAFSIVLGVLGSVLSVLCFHGYIIHLVDGIVFLAVIVMSQVCRLALESMKELARVQTRADIKYQPWIHGVLDLVNPYLLAIIVFHPYVKALIKS